MEKKILIIDDNQLAREINCSVLQAAGYKTITANDGGEGLKKLEEEKVDLVILDLMMPGIDGFAFLNVCKNDLSMQNISVVVLTSRDFKEEIGRVRILGARDCLVKHKMSPGALLESIKMILGK